MSIFVVACIHDNSVGGNEIFVQFYKGSFVVGMACAFEKYFNHKGMIPRTYHIFFINPPPSIKLPF